MLLNCKVNIFDECFIFHLYMFLYMFYICLYMFFVSVSSYLKKVKSASEYSLIIINNRHLKNIIKNKRKRIKERLNSKLRMIISY